MLYHLLDIVSAGPQAEPNCWSVFPLCAPSFCRVGVHGVGELGEGCLCLQSGGWSSNTTWDAGALLGPECGCYILWGEEEGIEARMGPDLGHSGTLGT